MSGAMPPAPSPPSVPSVLRKAYGQGIYTLKEALLQLAQGTAAAAELSATLERPDDSAAYRHLLHQHYVVLHGVPPAHPQLTLQQSCHQDEVVLRVIDTLVQQDKQNVLRNGYRRKRPGGLGDGCFVPGLTIAEGWCDASVTSQHLLQRGNAWSTLFARCGDGLMRHLLLHTAIFAPLASLQRSAAGDRVTSAAPLAEGGEQAGVGGNYLQLTGQPLPEVARQLAVQQQQTAFKGAPSRASSDLWFQSIPPTMPSELKLYEQRSSRHRQRWCCPPAAPRDGATPVRRAAAAANRQTVEADGTAAHVTGSDVPERSHTVLRPAHLALSSVPQSLPLSMARSGSARRQAQAVALLPTSSNVPFPSPANLPLPGPACVPLPKVAATVQPAVAAAAQHHSRPPSYMRRKAAKQRAVVAAAAASSVPAVEGGLCRVAPMDWAGPESPQRVSLISMSSTDAPATQVLCRSPYQLRDWGVDEKEGPAVAGDELPCLMALLHNTASSVGLDPAEVTSGPAPSPTPAARVIGHHLAMHVGCSRLPPAQLHGQLLPPAAAAAPPPPPPAALPGEHGRADMDAAAAPALDAPHRVPGALSRPRAWIQPSRLVLPHGELFYCATFGAKPGLPAKCILRILYKRRQAERVLYARIFTQPLFEGAQPAAAAVASVPLSRVSSTLPAALPDNISASIAGGPSSASLARRLSAQSLPAGLPPQVPVAGPQQRPLQRPQQQQQQQQHADQRRAAMGMRSGAQQYGLRRYWQGGTVPAAPRRVSGHHKAVLPLLRQMLVRARRCPFALLLSRHCPLPVALLTDATAIAAAASVTAEDDGGCAPSPSDALATSQLLAAAAAGRAAAAGGGNGPAGETAEAISAAADGQSKRRRLSRRGGAAAPGRLVRRGAPGAALPGVSAVRPATVLGRAGTAGTAGTAGIIGTAGSQGAGGAEAMEVDEEPRGGTISPGLHAAQQQLHMGQPSVPHSVGPSPAGSGQAPRGGNIAEKTVPGARAFGGRQDKPSSRNSAAPTASATAVPPGPVSLLSCCVQHSQVTCFVWSVVRHILPAVMLGSKANHRALRRHIMRYVGLNRHEWLSLHHVTQGIRMAHIPWLSGVSGTSRSAHAMAQYRLGRLIWWLFIDVVAPILRGSFYITETEPYKQQVFYYRKPVWSKLQSAALRDLLGQRFAPLTATEAQQCLEHRKLGVARLRLLPKMNGMRPIVNFGTSSRAVFRGTPAARARRPAGGHSSEIAGGRKRRFRKQPAPAVTLDFKPVNHILNYVYQVLKAETRARPALLASTVFKYDDIYQQLHPFVRQLRAARMAEPHLPVYLVSADVRRAFDSIDLSKLQCVAAPVVAQPHYTILQWWETMPVPPAVRSRIQRGAALGTGASHSLVHHLVKASKDNYCTVFSDKPPSHPVSRGEVLATLQEHTLRNVLKVGRRWYRQTRGIAQGSITSSLLCSLYLAELEQQHLLPLLPRHVRTHVPKQQQQHQQHQQHQQQQQQQPQQLPPLLPHPSPPHVHESHADARRSDGGGLTGLAALANSCSTARAQTAAAAAASPHSVRQPGSLRGLVLPPAPGDCGADGVATGRSGGGSGGHTAQTGGAAAAAVLGEACALQPALQADMHSMLPPPRRVQERLPSHQAMHGGGVPGSCSLHLGASLQGSPATAVASPSSCEQQRTPDSGAAAEGGGSRGNTARGDAATAAVVGETSRAGRDTGRDASTAGLAGVVVGDGSGSRGGGNGSGDDDRGAAGDGASAAGVAPLAELAAVGQDQQQLPGILWGAPSRPGSTRRPASDGLSPALPHAAAGMGAGTGRLVAGPIRSLIEQTLASSPSSEGGGTHSSSPWSLTQASQDPQQQPPPHQRHTATPHAVARSTGSPSSLAPVSGARSGQLMGSPVLAGAGPPVSASGQPGQRAPCSSYAEQPSSNVGPSRQLLLVPADGGAVPPAVAADAVGPAIHAAPAAPVAGSAALPVVPGASMSPGDGPRTPGRPSPPLGQPAPVTPWLWRSEPMPSVRPSAEHLSEGTRGGSPLHNTSQPVPRRWRHSRSSSRSPSLAPTEAMEDSLAGLGLHGAGGPGRDQAECHTPWLDLVPRAGACHPHDADESPCIPLVVAGTSPISPGSDVSLAPTDVLEAPTSSTCGSLSGSLPSTQPLHSTPTQPMGEATTTPQVTGPGCAGAPGTQPPNSRSLPTMAAPVASVARLVTLPTAAPETSRPLPGDPTLRHAGLQQTASAPARTIPLATGPSLAAQPVRVDSALAASTPAALAASLPQNSSADADLPATLPSTPSPPPWRPGSSQAQPSGSVPPTQPLSQAAAIATLGVSPVSPHRLCAPRVEDETSVRRAAGGAAANLEVAEAAACVGAQQQLASPSAAAGQASTVPGTEASRGHCNGEGLQPDGTPIGVAPVPSRVSLGATRPANMGATACVTAGEPQQGAAPHPGEILGAASVEPISSPVVGRLPPQGPQDIAMGGEEAGHHQPIGPTRHGRRKSRVLSVHRAAQAACPLADVGGPVLGGEELGGLARRSAGGRAAGGMSRAGRGVGQPASGTRDRNRGKGSGASTARATGGGGTVVGARAARGLAGAAAGHNGSAALLHPVQGAAAAAVHEDCAVRDDDGAAAGPLPPRRSPGSGVDAYVELPHSRGLGNGGAPAAGPPPHRGAFGDVGAAAQPPLPRHGPRRGVGTAAEPPAPRHGAGGSVGGMTAARPRSTPPESLLLRLVDDFLLVTTSHSAAEAVVRKMHNGFPDFGCSINPLKTQLNFDVQLPNLCLAANAWRDTAGGPSFLRWCGLLINVETLEVQADYSRYSGTHIRWSMSVPLVNQPGRQLSAKLSQYMRPKIHALLLDTTLNSGTTARVNIYQSFLLCALKLHWYVRSLGGCQVGSRDGSTLLHAVQRCINSTCSLIRSRTERSGRRLVAACCCRVSRCHIRWLGLRAFQKVLQRKQAVYRPVLTALSAQLSLPVYRHLDLQLADVVDSRRSAVFDTIGY